MAVDAAERARRIGVICEFMRQVRWSHDIRLELREKWKTSYGHILDLAKEAAAIVREEVPDPQRVSVTVQAALERVLTEALEMKDFRAVIDASRVWGQIAGLSGGDRERVQVNVNLHAKSLDALLVEAETLTAEVQTLARRLGSGVPCVQDDGAEPDATHQTAVAAATSAP